jgi:hypothetical protein
VLILGSLGVHEILILHLSNRYRFFYFEGGTVILDLLGHPDLRVSSRALFFRPVRSQKKCTKTAIFAQDGFVLGCHALGFQRSSIMWRLRKLQSQDKSLTEVFEEDSEGGDPGGNPSFTHQDEMRIFS